MPDRGSALWPRVLGRFAAGALAAQSMAAVAEPQEHLQDVDNQIQTTTAPPSGKPQLLVVPIPLSNPAIGSGITLVGVLFYNPNQSPQPWISGLGATRTSNGTWAAAAFHSMSLDHDRFRAMLLGGYGDANLKFYGIGPQAGARDAYVKIEDKGLFALVQGQMRVAKGLYFGARYQYLDLKSSIRLPNPIFPDLNLPELSIDSTISGIGPAVTYDTRDNSLNPRNGIYVTGTWLFNSKALGSDFSHDKLQIGANFYQQVGKETVVAARAAICGVTTGAPFYDLCNYGQMGDLRGYESGRYRDRATWVAQIELRQHLFGRFGAVAFGGTGAVAPSLGHLDDGKTLPSVGAGLRYLASKQNNVNLRLDYAWGKDSHALYFGIGEAF